jgi:flagellar protein FlaG
MAINDVTSNLKPIVDSYGKNLPQPEPQSDKGTAVASISKLPPGSEASLNPRDLQAEAVSQIEEFKNASLSINRSLRFKVDEDLGVTIIRVVDKKTNELIRQFPPEELLNLSKRLKELNEGDSDTSGVLFMKKV